MTSLLTGAPAQRRCPLCRRNISPSDVHKLEVQGLGEINRVAAAKRDALLDAASKKNGASDGADDDDNDDDDNDDDDGAEGDDAADDDDDHKKILALAIRAAKSLAAVAVANGANGGAKAGVLLREHRRNRAHRAVERLRAMLSSSRSASRDLRDIAATLNARNHNAKMVCVCVCVCVSLFCTPSR